jgi:predicted XRE-type DNA-binding protein
MERKDGMTTSSGNVFTDLDVKSSDELLAKSTLARTLREIIKQKGLTQAKAAKIFNTNQAQVSRLSSGSGIDGMSFDLLMNWLTRLDHNIIVTIKKAPKNQTDLGHIQVAV